MAADLLIQET